MFKRRTPKGYIESIGHFFYPRGGWARAGRYVIHRLRRLPDPAHKISRGIAIGVLVSFTPFFGMHFVVAAFLAYLIGGNIIASLLSTFFGNPITFPVIATASVELGSWILGKPHIPLPEVVSGFSYASLELWTNLGAIFTADVVRWSSLSGFMSNVFLPYLVGGLILGFLCGILAYFLANPIIASYQRGRISKIKQRFERRRRAIEAAKLKKAVEAAQARDQD